jgi:hypothetical protein
MVLADSIRQNVSSQQAVIQGETLYRELSGCGAHKIQLHRRSLFVILGF